MEEQRLEAHRHEPAVHHHEHLHVSHYLRHGATWEHLLARHAHEHNHAAVEHSHEAHEDEDQEHLQEAHVHDHGHPWA
jgi:hypothetical protein